MCAKPLEPEIVTKWCVQNHWSPKFQMGNFGVHMSRTSQIVTHFRKITKHILKILDCMEKVEECNPDMQIMVMSLLSFATRWALTQTVLSIWADVNLKA